MQHAADNRLINSLGHLTDINQTGILLRKILMHNSNAVDSVNAVTQNYFGFITLCATLLQTQQTGNSLQIILYAVMNLLDDNGFYQQLLIFFA